MGRPREFRLATTEMRMAAMFVENHEAMHGPNEVREGQRYIFEVSSCGIGTGTTIICNTCKARQDITDVDIW